MNIGIKSIAFVHYAMAIGGIERSLINLLNRVDFTKISVDFYILTTSDTMLNELNPNVNVIFRINQFEKALTKLAASSSGVIATICSFALKVQRGLVRWISAMPHVGKYVLGTPITKKYDAVFALSQGIVQFFALENLTSRKKYAFYHNGNIEFFNKHLNCFLRFEGIILVSNELMELIASHHPNLVGKLHVMHNIVPQDEIRSLSLADTVHNECQNERRILVSCGRLNFEKGFDMAVDAARILNENALLDFDWYIIGDGKERNSLNRKIREHSLQDRVFLIGWKMNPYPYMRACHLYIQPSRIESFGISMVEAQVLGKIVVATETLGAKEVISDRVTGVLCNISASSIAEKIEDIMRDKQHYNDIQANVARIDFEKRNANALEKFTELIAAN